jgi:hypothetical protein
MRERSGLLRADCDERPQSVALIAVVVRPWRPNAPATNGATTALSEVGSLDGSLDCFVSQRAVSSGP